MRGERIRDGIYRKMEMNGTKFKENGISISTLKIIAVITMLIDHAAIVFLSPVMRRFEIGFDLKSCFYSNNKYALLYITGRLIGRLAFLIFAFCLVEGFKYTRSKLQYGFRLFAFSIISEIPFDLAFDNKIVSFEGQNVFFTLFLGFISICITDAVLKIAIKRNFNVTSYRLTVILAGTIAGVVMGIIGEIIRCDYGFDGVVTIIIIYMMWKLGANNALSSAAGAVILIASNIIEVTALLDVIIIHRYKGKKGINLKYFFYFFYPIHLIILYYISIKWGR